MNVCVLDGARTCQGCRRTLDEIAQWGRMSATEQWQVIARIEHERERRDAAEAGKAAASVASSAN